MGKGSEETWSKKETRKVDPAETVGDSQWRQRGLGAEKETVPDLQALEVAVSPVNIGGRRIRIRKRIFRTEDNRLVKEYRGTSLAIKYTIRNLAESVFQNLQDSMYHILAAQFLSYRDHKGKPHDLVRCVKTKNGLGLRSPFVTSPYVMISQRSRDPQEEDYVSPFPFFWRGPPHPEKPVSMEDGILSYPESFKEMFPVYPDTGEQIPANTENRLTFRLQMLYDIGFEDEIGDYTEEKVRDLYLFFADEGFMQNPVNIREERYSLDVRNIAGWLKGIMRKRKTRSARFRP